MQAVEQGQLKLDDAKQAGAMSGNFLEASANTTQVHYLCPELNKKKVLRDDGTLEDRKNDITLRMLLSHTSGFAYELYGTIGNPNSSPQILMATVSTQSSVSTVDQLGMMFFTPV